MGTAVHLIGILPLISITMITPSSSECSGDQDEYGSCPDLPECNACKPKHCVFSDWHDWHPAGGCSGLEFRQRSQSKNNECGRPCNGTRIESRRQSLPPECASKAKDCEFSSWDEWSVCDKSNPYHQKVRARRIVEPDAGGKPCYGSLTETETCTQISSVKPLPCSLSNWQEWTSCSATCGGGRHSRVRRIIQEAINAGHACRNSTLETHPCNTKACPAQDCVLSTWLAWSACSEFQTQRYRIRSVVQGSLGSGKECDTTLQETEGCPESTPIDCTVSKWSEWTECDKPCGHGQKYRNRTLASPNVHGGKCRSFTLEETLPCQIGLCHKVKTADCQMTTWGEWSACSSECGRGMKVRDRTVAKPADKGGQGCTGALKESVMCMGTTCSKVDCKWGDWYGWSACTCSCGGGTKRRNRAVMTPPANGGLPCTATVKSQVGPCNTQPCSNMSCIDGKWGEWMSWSPCSAPCASSYKSRRRDIEQQPNACGRPVDGVREEFEVCSGLPSCTVDKDCQLSDWGEWSFCSCACFGIRERNRFVKVFAAGEGKPCVDKPLKQIEPCNPGVDAKAPAKCAAQPPEDCVLGSWSEWSTCSATCGGGQMQRTRSVQIPPARAGKQCDQDLSITAPCKTAPCTTEVCVDCEFSPWSEWSECSKCGGQRYRHRQISRLPNHCGRMCSPTSAREASNCTSTCKENLHCAWTSWSTPSTCDGGCGSSTAMRSRALGFRKSADASFFEGTNDMKCAGTQLSIDECPRQQSCTPPCIPQHCKFAQWSDWHAPTCVGLCERFRVIEQVNNECGDPCSGPLLDTKRCYGKCTKVHDCHLSSWTDWSECGAFHADQKRRSRNVDQMPANGGKPCEGILVETESCKEVPTADCVFSSWSAFTPCSSSCGLGIQKRKRNILRHAIGTGELCKGSLFDIQKCHQKPCPGPVNCILSSWTSFSACHADGQRYRERKISQHAQNGGSACKGIMAQTKTCGAQVIDCKMSPWTKWGMCDKMCGGGQAIRQRQVERFPENGGTACPSALLLTQGCSMEACKKQDCQLSKWSGWSACSSSCGPGQQIRGRSVRELRTARGVGCNDVLAESRPCLSPSGEPNPPCKGRVDCKWEDWNDWSDCTCTCDGGQHTRSRKIKQSPQAGGQMCAPEDKEEVAPCNTQPCHKKVCIDGKFGAWADWQMCTATCGGGQTVRTRSIEREANECGKPATGLKIEVRFCNVGVPCSESVDCQLSKWTDWQSCSATCDGTKQRSRHVAKSGRGAGKFCVGALEQTWPCNPSKGEDPPQGCNSGAVVDCQLSEWTKWGPCSATCGRGQHFRERTVSQNPAGGGKGCADPLREVQECSAIPCGDAPTPVDCKYSDWRDWDECTKCSGQRNRYRHVKQTPKNGGHLCDPKDVEETQDCPRKCHDSTTKYCIWQDWGVWGGCAVSCGSGYRKRRRSLHFSDTQASPPLDMISKYEQLFQGAEDLRPTYIQDATLGFMSGCLSLMVLLFAARCYGSGRHCVERGSSNSASFSQEVSQPAGYLHETELPLVGSDYNSGEV